MELSCCQSIWAVSAIISAYVVQPISCLHQFLDHLESLRLSPRGSDWLGCPALKLTFSHPHVATKALNDWLTKWCFCSSQRVRPRSCPSRHYVRTHRAAIQQTSQIMCRMTKLLSKINNCRVEDALKSGVYTSIEPFEMETWALLLSYDHWFHLNEKPLATTAATSSFPRYSLFPPFWGLFYTVSDPASSSFGLLVGKKKANWRYQQRLEELNWRK